MNDRRRYGPQTPIPSQAPSREVPYKPERQSDILSTSDMQGAKPHGFPALDAFVVTTYDWRPINEFDWYESFYEQAVIDQVTIAVDFSTPAQGKRTILRYLELGAVYAIENDAQNPNQVMDKYGQWNFGVAVTSSNPVAGLPLRYSILVNNSPQENFANVPLFGPTINARRIPLNILVESGSTVQLQTTFGDPDEVAPTPAYAIWGSLYGHELANRDATDLQIEAANKRPLPVQKGFSSKNDRL